MCRFCALLLALSSWLVSTVARADLAAEATLLAQRWRQAGAHVTRLPTLFLFEGDVRAQQLRLPRGKRGRCLRVTVLSDRKVQFAGLASAAVKMGAKALQQAGDSSVAGSWSVDDCGNGALEDRRVLLAMLSARGSLELLLSRHSGSLAPVENVLKARAKGPLGASSRSVAPLRMAPLKQRIARARQVARSDGAQQVLPTTVVADNLGAGVVTLELREGCHRLHLLAAGSASGPHSTAVDIDAEVSSDKAGGLIGRDRSHAVDARLDFCVGEAGPVAVRYAGAGGARKVTVLDAFWPPAPALPRWGPLWRAGAHYGLWRRHAPAPYGAPVAQALGPAGVSWLPLQVEPNTCYLALAAMMQGDATAMRLTARWRDEVRYDDATHGPLGTVVTFCTGSSRRLDLKVDVRGRAATWALTLWNMTAVDS